MDDIFAPQKLKENTKAFAFVTVLLIAVFAVVVGVTVVSDTAPEDMSVPHATPPDSIASVHDGMNGSGTQDDPYMVTDDYELQAIRHDPTAAYQLANGIDATGTSEWAGIREVHAGHHSVTNNDTLYHAKIPLDYNTILYENKNNSFEELDIEDYEISEDGNITFINVPSNMARIEDKRANEGADLKYTFTKKTGFQPIGNSAENSFNGSIDGNGHTITGLTVNRRYTLDGSPGISTGMIGHLSEDSTVENLAITNPNITGAIYVGSLAGRIYDKQDKQETVAANASTGVIRNVDVSGAEVTGTRYVGSLIGSAQDGTIEDVTTDGSVTGNLNVGGVAGELGGQDAGGLVSNVSSEATVRVEERTGGGIIGWNTGTVEKSVMTGTVRGSSDVGGISGEIAARGTVTESYFTGEVDGNVNVGGVAGFAQGRLSDSYSAGRVNGSSEVGGLVGSANRIDISQSYATGQVTGSEKIGGIAGETQFEDSSFSSSYWDRASTTQPSTENGTILSSAEMQGSSVTTTMNGLDFGDTWRQSSGLLGLNSDYPELRFHYENRQPDTLVERIKNILF